jgi:hypothetical protein
MSRAQKTLFFTSMIVGQAVVWTAAALMAVGMDPTNQIGYTTEITWELLARGFGKLGPADVLAGLGLIGLFGLITMAAVAAVFMKTWGHRAHAGRILVCTIHPLVAWWSWMGLLSLIGTLTSDYFDGEWMGESWPIIEATGIWTLCSTTLFIQELREYRKAEHAAGPYRPKTSN